MGPTEEKSRVAHDEKPPTRDNEAGLAQRHNARVQLKHAFVCTFSAHQHGRARLSHKGEPLSYSKGNVRRRTRSEIE